MWKYNETEDLYHWGILGMKWGHRKTNPVKEIKRYGILKKRNDLKTKAENKQRSKTRELRNEVNKSYEKSGYSKTRLKYKIGRGGTAAISAIAGLNAINSGRATIKAIREGNKSDLGLHAALTAMHTINHFAYKSWNKDIRRKQNMLNDMEYKRLNKKYKKIIK